MPNPPPRKRFQIHLSTAIVMMFVAGALVWANVTKRNELISIGQKVEALYHSYGWPLTAFREGVKLKNSAWNYQILDDPNENTGYQESSIAVNAIVALVLLAVICVLSEWLIRRRAARKGA